MGKKRNNHKQKPKRKTSKVAPSSGSGSPINTKNPLYYWDGVEFPQELQEEYKKALEQLKAGQYQALHLEKLHVHNGDGRDYWSIRTNQKGRLILTSEFVEGKRVLVFVRALPNHEYEKWERSLPSMPKSSPIQEQPEIQPASAEDVQHIKGMLQTVDTTQVTGLKSYLGKYILLSQPQNEIVEIDGPCIVNGVAGSGKTSSALFLASRWREKNPHGEVVCIASSKEVVKGIEDEFKAEQAAKCKEEEKSKEEEKGKEEEKEEKTVQFKTYAEWLCTDGGHKELKSRETILKEFEKWWEDYSQSCKERYRNQEKTRNRSQNKGHHSSSSSSLSFFMHADAPEAHFLNMDAMQLYQEFRKISNEEDYVKKGMGSFIAQGEGQQALRAVIYAAYKACPDKIKEESEDFASLQEQSKEEQKITLVLVDEAQDLSKQQIENIIQWAAARGLRVVFFRDSLQTVRDASSNYLIIKDCFVKVLKDSSLHQQEIKEINLPVSYRSFPAAKPWVDGWLDIRKKLTEKMDKTEVVQLEVKVNEHAAPGSVHWITEIDVQKQALFNAGCESPSFAIVAPKEYLAEAKSRFNTELVFTPEEIKGRQFKIVLVYRPFSPDIFKDASRILEQDRTKHSIRKQNNNNDLITSCNEVFVSLTRADSQMIIYQPEEHGISTLVKHFTKDKVVDVKADFSLILEKSDASEEKWLQEAKMQLRYGYIEKAEEIITYHVKKEELKKEFIEFRMGYVEAKKEPSCSVPKQEELKREKAKGKGKEKEETLPDLVALAEEGNIDAQYKVYCRDINNPSLDAKAIGFCLSAAKGGHIKARYSIAKEYFLIAKEIRELPDEKCTHTETILEYEKEAYGWCLMAVESNDPMAQHLLCIMYGEGKGIPLDMKASFHWCSQSAMQQFPPALYDLARLYYHGDGTEKDLKQAEFWCRKAIEHGHQKATFLLENIEAEKLGNGVFSSITPPILSSVEYPSFFSTNYMDQHNLNSLSGNEFAPGSSASEPEGNLCSIKQSDREAADSIYTEIKEKGKDFLPNLIELADGGNMYAQYNLFRLYKSNHSLKERYPGEAWEFCHKAADKGYPVAQYALAYSYYSEAVKLKDLPNQTEKILECEKLAYKWCLMAAQSNDRRAQHLLAVMHTGGTGASFDMKEAFGWLYKSAIQGFPAAFYGLAEAYRTGEGTEKNLKEAEFWCRKSIEHGEQEAMALLEDIKAEKLEKISFLDEPMSANPIEQSNADPLSGNIFTLGSSSSAGVSSVSYFKKKPDCSENPHLALRQAAARGDIAKIKELVESPLININQQGPESGKTALHQAALNGREEAVKLLLELDADPMLLDKEGKSALDLASQKGYSDICSLLEQIQYKPKC